LVDDVQEVIDKLSANERKVLLALASHDGAEVERVREDLGFSELVEVMNAASWLASKGLVRIGERVDRYLIPGPGAAEAIEGGLPERRALTALASVGMLSVPDLGQESGLEKGDVSLAMGWMRKKGWADIRRVDGAPVVEITAEGEAANEAGAGADEELMARLVGAGTEGLPEGELDPDARGLLKGRKELVRVREDVIRTLHLTDLGHTVLERGFEVTEEVAQLTPQLLRSGRWRQVQLRPYDVQAYAPALHGGRPHPIREVLERVRSVFKQMGFTEIYGHYVDSTFWNMDALFVPQDHPARDEQDTLYLSQPAEMEVDEELLPLIKRIHLDGGETGSRGWGGEFSDEESKRAMLRTHTTCNTVRYLQDHPDPPVKVFSLGRVFRREAVDSSHLPEFYQIEGIVMEEAASFAMLVGLLREFYTRLGFEDIRLRPGYFPYTEPSMEVEVLLGGKWLEMGGSGVFRPEVTAPYGVKHPVLAWGQGLERITMIMYGIDDMRQLYETDLGWLRSRPLG
jgi:phenylalanyl-tRNA synthetase alpha chain